MELTTSALLGFRTRYETIFNQAFNVAESTIQKVAFVFNSGRVEQVVHRWLSGIGMPKEFLDERKIANLMTAGQTITNKLWENTVGVPRTALERDQYGVYDPFIARMGQLAKLHRDSLGYGLLSSMLSDTSIKAYDNIAFYGNHNTGRVTAAQFNNKSAAALGALSLQAGIAALRARRDNKGVPLAAAQARPLLVVPPSLEFVAAQLATLSFIVGTQPGSGASSATSQAAQQENVLKGTFDYIVVPWLATATEWHLTLVDPLYKPVILQIETEPEIMTPPQYFAEDWAKRDQFVVGSRALHNVAPGLPEMAYGSTGA